MTVSAEMCAINCLIMVNVTTVECSFQSEEVAVSTKDWLKLVCSIKGNGKHRSVVDNHMRNCTHYVTLCRSVSLHMKSSQELLVRS